MSKITLFWFRRDLRLEDNAAFFYALKERRHVQPIFIFDPLILGKLEDKSDARVTFINDVLENLKAQLQSLGSDLWIFHQNPIEVHKYLSANYQIESVYFNHDYEPYARQRDDLVNDFWKSKGVPVNTYKDQTLFEKSEVLTGQGRPYTVYTPYKKNVLSKLNDFYLKSYPTDLYLGNLNKSIKSAFNLHLEDMGFVRSSIAIPPLEVSSSLIKKYAETRDFPYLDSGTSKLGLHLRFGTISVRELAREGLKLSETYLSELIWRDFFMQILWHYPHVERESFRREYDKIAWRTSASDLDKWKNGQTGYPIVDAGMRELNTTGHMHNRVRMIVASFLTKHLLIHWYEGERYFASKLLDFDLSANNGNWQWAAGSGCDAAPYFRVFNPTTQMEKFDPDLKYVKKWVPEVNSFKYPRPMIDHNEARGRCLAAYSKVLKGEKS